MRTFTKQQFEEVKQLCNDMRSGGFVVIKGYTNKDGEKSDYCIQFGCDYGNILKSDIAKLQNTLEDKHSFTLKVKHNVWVETTDLPKLTKTVTSDPTHAIHGKATYKQPSMGEVTVTGWLTLEICGNRKSGSRTPVELEYEISSSHSLVSTAIGNSLVKGTLLQSLANPAKSSANYTSEAKGLDSMTDDPTRLYLRNTLKVWKKVIQACEYPFKASLPMTAIKDTIERQELRSGKIRQFILSEEDAFESITINDAAIVQDADGDLCVTSKELVPAQVQA